MRFGQRNGGTLHSIARKNTIVICLAELFQQSSLRTEKKPHHLFCRQWPSKCVDPAVSTLGIPERSSHSLEKLGNLGTPESQCAGRKKCGILFLENAY